MTSINNIQTNTSNIDTIPYGVHLDKLKTPASLTDEEILKLVNFNNRFCEMQGNIYSLRHRNFLPFVKCNFITFIRTIIASIPETGYQAPPENHYEISYNNRLYNVVTKVRNQEVRLLIFQKFDIINKGGNGFIHDVLKISTAKNLVLKSDKNPDSPRACKEGLIINEIHAISNSIKDELQKEFDNCAFIEDRKGKERLAGIVAMPTLIMKNAYLIKKYKGGSLCSYVQRMHSYNPEKLSPTTSKTLYKFLADSILGMLILDKAGCTKNGGPYIHTDFNFNNILIDESYDNAYVCDLDGLIELHHQENAPAAAVPQKFIHTKKFTPPWMFNNEHPDRFFHFRKYLAAQLVVNVMAGELIFKKKAAVVPVEKCKSMSATQKDAVPKDEKEAVQIEKQQDNIPQDKPAENNNNDEGYTEPNDYKNGKFKKMPVRLQKIVNDMIQNSSTTNYTLRDLYDILKKQSLPKKPKAKESKVPPVKKQIIKNKKS